MSLKIKTKRLIKGIAAISAGAMFLGATLSGALAAKYSISVDADATAATKLATGASTTDKLTKDIGIGSGIVNTTQPEDYFDNPLDDDDLAILQDSTVSYDDGSGYDAYDISDEMWFGADSPSIETSLSTNNVDKDYKSGVAMEVGANSIYYYYVFDEAINASLVSEDNPLELKFFGKNIKITNTDADGGSTTADWGNGDVDRITVKVGETYYMNIGDTISVNGHTVKLEDVGDDKVAMSVDGGEIVSITADNTKEWAEGIAVNVDSVFYKSGDPTKSTASLVIGPKATESFTDGDEYIGEEENNEKWRWEIGDLDGNTGTTTTITTPGTTVTGPILGIQNYFVVDDSSDTDPAPVIDSGCYDIPTKDPYAQVCLAGLNVPTENYATVDVDFATVDIRDAGGTFAEMSSVPVLRIQSDVIDSLQLRLADATADEFGAAWSGIIGGSAPWFTTTGITSNVKTDTIYLAPNATNASTAVAEWIEVFYVDSDNDVAYAGNIVGNGAGSINGSFASVDYKDTKAADVQFWLADCGGNYCLNITALDSELPGSGTGRTFDNISINLDNSTAHVNATGITTGEWDHLGITANSEEASDIWYVGGGELTAGLGTQDEDLRTKYGIVIKDPETFCADDNIQLLIPGDAVRGKVTVGAYGAIGAAFVEEAKLVTEVAAVETGSILVGGPAANEWAAKAMGKPFPTYGSALGWTDGWCYIKDLSLDGKTVTVIAGWDATDTSACVDKYISGTRSSDAVLA